MLSEPSRFQSIRSIWYAVVLKFDRNYILILKFGKYGQMPIACFFIKKKRPHTYMTMRTKYICIHKSVI